MKRSRHFVTIAACLVGLILSTWLARRIQIVSQSKDLVYSLIAGAEKATPFTSSTKPSSSFSNARSRSLTRSTINASILSPAFDLPLVHKEEVTGSFEGWDNSGFIVSRMASLLAPKPINDLRPTFHIGHNSRGLLIYADIVDHTPYGPSDPSRLFNGDSIEIVVADTTNVSRNFYSIILSPYLSEHGRPSIQYSRVPLNFDPSKTGIEAKSLLKSSGYVIEVLIPWAGLGYLPSSPKQSFLQLYVFDKTSPRAAANTYYWYPSEVSWRLPKNGYRVQCELTASPEINFAIYPEISSPDEGGAFTARGATSIANKRIQLISNDGRIVAESKFELVQNEAVAELTPDTSMLQAGEEVVLTIDGVPKGVVPFDQIKQNVSAKLLQLEAKGQCVFVGSALPAFEWNDNLLAESLLGNSSITVRYYDCRFNEVQNADRPGRYGAIIESIDRNHKSVQRFVTLCRIPSEFLGWDYSKDGLDAFPKHLANYLNKKIVSAYPRSRDFWAQSYDEADLVTPRFASLVSWLLEANSKSTNPSVADSQWWTDFRRKIYGLQVRYPTLSEADFINHEGADSPTLRTGTATEAGLSESVITQLEAICSAGAKEFPDEPISCCFARNGIIFFQRAYGHTSDGSPFTTDTAGNVTSVAKVITGIAAASLVERHRINFDRPIDGWARGFENVANPDQITLRHFFSHMSGVGSEGYRTTDAAEYALNMLPSLVPMTYKYSSQGYFIIGELMEDYSGLAIPTLLDFAVFHPLNLKHAESLDSSGGEKLTSRELAVIGQVVLNRGSYGSVRLISPQTFDSMLPRQPFGPRGVGLEATSQLYGVNTSGLPLNTLGHSSGNSTGFYVLPDEKIVFSIVAGSDFGPRRFSNKYQKLLFKAVLASIGRGSGNGG